MKIFYKILLRIFILIEYVYAKNIINKVKKIHKKSLFKYHLHSIFMLAQRLHSFSKNDSRK